MSRTGWVKVSTTFLLTLFTVNVFAGGLYLREFGQPAQSTAGAGGNVLAQDASTAFQNPAGVFNLKGDSEWMVTGIVLDSSVKFKANSDNTVVGNNGGDAGDTLFGGALFHTRKLNDDWGLTFSLNSVAGSVLEYDEEYVGRYTGYETELITITFSPSVAYKVNDELSVAAGINVLYGELELDQAIPALVGPVVPGRDGLAKVEDGDDIDWAPRASLLWQATEDWRFALAYSGEVELDFNGDLELTLPGAGSGVTFDNIGAEVEFTFPQTLSGSAMLEVNEQWSLMTRVAWEEWSSLESIPLDTNAAGLVVPLDWDDVWSVSAGFRYITNADWTWYGGVAWDSDPGQASTRVAILPVDRQWRFAGGFSYDIDQNREIGASLTYVDLGDARTDVDTLGGVYAGEFTTNELIIFGVNFGWR